MMDWFGMAGMRLWCLFHRKRMERDLDDEMSFHLELLIRENIQNGMTPDAARKAAIKEFGNLEALKEECRDPWGTRLVENLNRHLRFAARMMYRRKSFTAIVVLTLGLGIGANTAIYSLANAVMFRSLPFPDAEQLIIANERTKDIPVVWVSYPNFKDWRERQKSFSAIGVSQNFGYIFSGPDGVESISASIASHDYFEALKIKPLAGRLFSPEDDKPGIEPITLVSERFWRSRFGGRESLIGDTIELTGQLYTVIGILPSIYPLDNIDVWTPIGLVADQNAYTNRLYHGGLFAYARLKPSVTVDQAREDLNRIADQLAEEHPGINTGLTVTVDLLSERLFRNAKPALLALLAASGLLLLIVCANVANMQLARSNSRRHEFAIRASIGASRRQILGQLSVESLTLGLIGGALGLVLALGATSWLKEIFADSLPRISEVEIDGPALFYAIGASVTASVLFGMAPIRHVLRISQRDALNSGMRSSDSLGGRKWKNALIISEFALTATLLVGAGLMLRTTANLYNSDPGFEADNRLVFRWNLSDSRYDNFEYRIQTINRAESALSELSKTKRIGITSGTPLLYAHVGIYYVEGSPLPSPGEYKKLDRFEVNNHFFDTLSIKLIEGRAFNDFDTIDGQRVAIVDSRFAELNFPEGDPIGKRIVLGNSPPSNPREWMTIVGVVDHVKISGIADDSGEQVYRPIRQASERGFFFIIESQGDTAKTTELIRETMAKIDPGIPIPYFQTYDAIFDGSVSNERLLSQILAILAGLALLLAAVGLYGTLSYAVEQRIGELGIRIAIGASPGSVRNLVLSYGAKLAGIGLAVGLIASLGLSRFLRDMLYEVSQWDATSFIAVAGILTVIGLVACWVPAYRATRIGPSLALRRE